MTRRIFKFVSFVTALCVFLSCVSVCAFALGEADSVEIQGERVDMIQISPDAELPYVQNNSLINFFSGSSTSEGWLFYNQLTDRQKGMYTDIKNAGVTDTITLNLTEYYVGTGETQSDASYAVQPELTYDIKAALTAVMEDNPMIFWPNGFTYRYSYYPDYDDTTAIYTAEVRKVTLIVYFDEMSYADFTEVQQKYTELAAAVEAFKVNGFNRYEKLKSINDSLCDLITYPEQQGYVNGYPYYGPMAHNPTGALLNGSAVCEGYAEAMKLICDREGIPCITAVGYGNGGAHKWNYVQMDDGLWYLLDATWNDQVTSIYYNDFLTGSDFDGGLHVNTGSIFSNSISLQYPTLSTETYSYTVPMTDTPDMAFNNTNGVLYIGKDIADLNEAMSYVGLLDGYEISWTNFYNMTGETVSFTNTETTLSKSYLMAVRGDINASSTVNSADYTLTVRAAAARYKVTDKSANFYAADINQDGAVDGFDAIAHELYTNGELTFD